MSILYPLRSVIRRGYTRYIIVSLWTASALVSIPNAIQVEYINVGQDDDPMWVCTTGMYSSLQGDHFKMGHHCLREHNLS